MTTTAGDVPVDRAMNTVGSVLYDAVVVVADGTDAVATLANDGYAVHFIAEAYKHAKTLGVLGVGDQLVLAAVYRSSKRRTAGRHRSAHRCQAPSTVSSSSRRTPTPTRFLDELTGAIARHRHYDRPVDGIAA